MSTAVRSTSSAQVSASKYHSSMKGPRLLGERTETEAGYGNAMLPKSKKRRKRVLKKKK